jgi:membrane protease YdiL (CAAX protease family)
LITDSPAFLKRALAAVVAAITALVIAILPQGIWSALIAVNLRTSPTIPWAVVVMAGLLILYWQYLGGRFPTSRTSDARLHHLRARRVPLPVFAWAVLAGSFAVIALIGLWIILAQVIRMPGTVLPPMGNLAWPIAAAAIGMAALISPICEQAGIWGYGQTMLREEFTASSAIAVSALIFALAPHPPFHVPLLPKIAFFFLAGVNFAVLAELTNSILPGLTVHILGLLAFFTLIWPNDPGRRLLSDGGADIWFYVHLAQVVAFALLAIIVMFRLSEDRPSRTTTMDG